MCFKKDYSVKRLQNWEQCFRYRIFIDDWREERAEHIKIKKEAVAMYQWRKSGRDRKYIWLSEIPSPRTPHRMLSYHDALTTTAYLGILCTSGCSANVGEYEIVGDEIIFYILYGKEKDDRTETRMSRIEEFEEHGVEIVYKILENGDIKYQYAIDRRTGKKRLTFHGEKPIYTKRL